MWLWRRMLRISWMEKRTDNSILQELEIKRELLGHVRKRKLTYYGHLCRDHGCQLTKTVVEGYVEGRRRRGRPRKQYIDNIKQWTQLTTSQCVRAAEDRSRWKQLVSQAMVADDYTWSAEKKKKIRLIPLLLSMFLSNTLIAIPFSFMLFPNASCYSQSPFFFFCCMGRSWFCRSWLSVNSTLSVKQCH